MIDIILSGANGKMGRCIAEIAKSQNVNIVAGISRKEIVFPFPVYQDFSQVKASGVIVDFSSPEVLKPLLEFAIKNNLPAVLCTTGYGNKEEREIKNASRFIPVFLSPNTSSGITAIKGFIKSGEKLLSGWDIDIIEKHHKTKKDIPSGTAKSLAKEIEKVFGVVPNVYSLRSGSTVGEHQIIFSAPFETVSITHKAESKKLFAIGAIKCANFIKDKKSGLYSMSDLE